MTNTKKQIQTQKKDLGKQMELLFRRYKIPLILILLVLGIAYLSYYNYKTQRELLLTQMHNNSLNIASSVSSAINRFNDIKSTMNLQKLVNDVSFDLEIFEFRFLEPDGTIRNSMFKEEIGKVYTNKSYIRTMQGEQDIKKFFFEVRDYVDVMAIYYPIYKDNELIGLIDLAVDISEYQVLDHSKDNFSVLRRQADITNLLKSIEGSIKNSLDVSAKTDINKFLHNYVTSSKNIVEISILDAQNKVQASSNPYIINRVLTNKELPPPELITLIEDQPIYRTLSKMDIKKQDTKNLKILLITDASAYTNIEFQLIRTASVTTFIALLFALFTTRSIYYSAIEQSRKEKERLEMLVKERTKAIEILSKTDALTGLWNRRYLEEMLEMEFKRARRHNFDISMMIIDLDHFKNVNDTYGHMAGDEVLREISSRITSCLRETDFIGRYGGEELVVILPMTTLHVARKVAKIILETISAKPVRFESQNIEMTASIGMSCLREEHADHLQVFAEADEALYVAKENGRNRIEVYEHTKEDIKK